MRYNFIAIGIFILISLLTSFYSNFISFIGTIVILALYSLFIKEIEENVYVVIFVLIIVMVLFYVILGSNHNYFIVERNMINMLLNGLQAK